MKKLAMILGVAVAGTCAGAAAAQEQDNLANAVITKTISLASYCDGYSLSIDNATGIVTGTRTGCESGVPVYGTLGDITGQGLGVTIRDDKYNELKVLRANQTWTYYKTGGAISNSGTWAAADTGVQATGAGNSSSSD